MNDFRAQAEAELAVRIAKHGPVTNREAYLDAIVRRLENQPTKPAPAAPKTDYRPDCARCDGNGWVETISDEHGYQYVTRCPDCDHGRVNLRSAAEPVSTPEIAKTHLAIIRDQSHQTANHAKRTAPVTSTDNP